MNQISPFQFDDKPIRVVSDENGDHWFVAKEVADVLEYSDTEAMTRKLDDDEKQILQIVGFGPRGVTIINESGLYSCILSSQKAEAKRFKRWVTREVLPSIRKAGAYVSPSAPSVLDVQTEAFRLIPTVVKAANALGLDKNAAALSANQAVAKMTGTNVLQLLGHTHLEAENQQLVFSPTELGERIGVSGRKFNMLLAEAGLQVKRGDQWVPLPDGEEFARILDSSKRHSDGSMIQQVKWTENVLLLVKQAA